MSRTDKTRPYWVKATETPMVTCVPVHQHQSGECTLPDDPADGLHGPADRCHWVPRTDHAHTGQLRCGCALCTDQAGRRARRRRDRRAGRAEAAAARRGVIADWDI